MTEPEDIDGDRYDPFEDEGAIEQEPEDEVTVFGKGDHIVRQGECIESIAEAAGHFWQTLWDHPENAELKQERDPNALMPGDRVFVPPLRAKEETLAVDQVHHFRRKGVPSRLRIVFRVLGEPRANAAYVLEVGSEQRHGTTDGDGLLDEPIPPNAWSATVIFDFETLKERRYRFDVGGMDPAESVSGIQHRLRNQGYPVPIDGRMDDGTRAAIRQFQRDMDIEVSGELDDDTRQKLGSLPE